MANVWDVGPALSQRWANTCGGGVARPDPIHWELVWKGVFFQWATAAHHVSTNYRCMCINPSGLYISSPWIWKGVSATWKSGRYTLSYPRGRFYIMTIEELSISLEVKQTGPIFYRPLGYERVYLPLFQVADTPFHIQGDDIKLVLFVLLLVRSITPRWS